jgi:hypothetical protein
MATAAVIARILTQYSDKGSKAAQKDIAKLEKKISAFGKKALKSFAVAGAAAGAFAVKIGMDAVKGAAADEKAQTSLAMAIRNSTAATEEAISANTKFLDQLELQVAVDNEELIPALQRLVNATGDLSQAQNLLVLSTDVAVASGKDLGAVATAISKAVNGQFGALTKLGLPIDATALKQKDLNKILSDFAKISKGQASASANTFEGRLKILRLSINQVLDRLGYALLPVVIEFSNYIISDVIPNIDEWVAANEGRLQNSFKEVVKSIESIAKNSVKLIEVLERYKVLIATLSAIPFIAFLGGQLLIIKNLAVAFNKGIIGPVFRYLGKIPSALSKATAAFKTAQEAAKAVGGGFDTTKSTTALNGIRTSANLLIKRLKVLTGIVALLGGIAGTIKILTGKDDVELLKEMQEETKRLFQEEQARKKQAEQDRILYDQNLKLEIAAAKAAADAEAKRAAAAKKTAAIEAKNAAIKKRIEATTGLKLTDQETYETIQLTAVEKLQKKQKEADASLADRIKLRKEELALFTALNQNAQRYSDLLAALADEKLSDKEVELLAKKWGLTVDGAKSYIFTVFAIKNEQISDAEVAKLAEAWGITKSKAGQYLDFFAALNDGKLSDTEIANLMSKWNLTKDEAKKYADFVSAIGDGKLDDAEINKLKNAWGLTTKEVVDYITKIGGKVDATGTILSAGDIAALGWTNALAALNEYLAKLKLSTGSTPGIGAPGTPLSPDFKPDLVLPVNPIKPGDKGFIGPVAPKPISPPAGDYLKLGPLGGLSAGVIAGVTTAAAKALDSGQIKQNDMQISSAFGAGLNYSELFKFQSNTMNNAGSLIAGGMSNSGGATTVNVTVNGSVSTEQDLVQTIRQGLLRGQTNGYSLALQAI